VVRGEGRKYFFFEKKKQKTFALLVDATGTIGTYLSESKFFGSFFQKRTASCASAGWGKPHGAPGQACCARRSLNPVILACGGYEGNDGNG
jgi:hypothetical protein